MAKLEFVKADLLKNAAFVALASAGSVETMDSAQQLAALSALKAAFLPLADEFAAAATAAAAPAKVDQKKIASVLELLDPLTAKDDFTHWLARLEAHCSMVDCADHEFVRLLEVLLHVEGIKMLLARRSSGLSMAKPHIVAALQERFGQRQDADTARVALSARKQGSAERFHSYIDDCIVLAGRAFPHFSPATREQEVVARVLDGAAHKSLRAKLRSKCVEVSSRTLANVYSVHKRWLAETRESRDRSESPRRAAADVAAFTRQQQHTPSGATAQSVPGPVALSPLESQVSSLTKQVTDMTQLMSDLRAELRQTRGRRGMQPFRPGGQSYRNQQPQQQQPQQQSQPQQPQQQQQQQQPRPFYGQCYRCHEVGHIALDCPLNGQGASAAQQAARP